MRIYGLKSCDTCKKAIRALPQAEFVDVRADGVPAAVMARALETFGEALVNRRSTTWRGLDEAPCDDRYVKADKSEEVGKCDSVSVSSSA